MGAKVLPKYEQIKKHIVQGIRDGLYHPHDLLPSEADFGRQFSASRATVRRSLTELALQGVIYQVQGKGTFVAGAKDLSDSGVAQETTKIGIVIPYTSDYFLGKIVAGVEGYATKHGLSLVIAHSDHDQKTEEERIERFLLDGVGGIILFTADCPPANKHLDTYRNIGIPLVYIDRDIPGLGGDAVLGEDFEAGQAAARHFLHCHGKTVIGYFNCDRMAMTPTFERIRGVNAVLEEAGLKLDRRLVVDMVPLEPGLTFEQALKLDRERIKAYLTKNPSLEAVVTNNDHTAIKFYSVCRELGLNIPEDLAIISFANLEIGQVLHPQLTSFDQNPDLISEKACQILFRRMEEQGIGVERPIRVKVPYDLQIRESCGCQTVDR